MLIRLLIQKVSGGAMKSDAIAVAAIGRYSICRSSQFLLGEIFGSAFEWFLYKPAYCFSSSFLSLFATFVWCIIFITSFLSSGDSKNLPCATRPADISQYNT